MRERISRMPAKHAHRNVNHAPNADDVNNRPWNEQSRSWSAPSCFRLSHGDLFALHCAFGEWCEPMRSRRSEFSGCSLSKMYCNKVTGRGMSGDANGWNMHKIQRIVHLCTIFQVKQVYCSVNWWFSTLIRLLSASHSTIRSPHFSYTCMRYVPWFSGSFWTVFFDDERKETCDNVLKSKTEWKILNCLTEMWTFVRFRYSVNQLAFSFFFFFFGCYSTGYAARSLWWLF